MFIQYFDMRTQKPIFTEVIKRDTLQKIYYHLLSQSYINKDIKLYYQDYALATTIFRYKWLLISFIK